MHRQANYSESDLLVMPVAEEPFGQQDGSVTEDNFFRGLVAALAAEGVRFIDTRDDRHQAALARAIDRLDHLREVHTPGVEGMPDDLFPGPITGKYEEFDEALLRLQELGYDSAQNPYYPGISITLDSARSERLLERFEPAQKRVLLDLARTYRDALPRTLNRAR